MKNEVVSRLAFLSDVIYKRNQVRSSSRIMFKLLLNQLLLNYVSCF